MKPLRVCTQISILVAILVVSYYVGRPVYWEVMSRAVQGYGRRPNRNSIAVMSPAADEKQEPEEGVPPPNREDEDVKPREGFRAYEVLQRPIWDEPPQGTRMPPIQAFALSNEMIKFRAKKNVIIVTFANHAFQDFVLTWVQHLTDVGVYNLLVGAMDTNLTADLFWKGVPVFDMGSGMNPADVGWGTPIFHKMGREKVYLINAILGLGYEVLFCDTDMVWLKDPLPYMERYPDADILVSSDSVTATVEDESLEKFEQSFSALNIGIFHWRPSEAAKKFAREWKALLEDATIWDQNGFNELMQKQQRLPVDGHSGLFYGFDKTLKVGILPVSIFCSGHTYFVQGLPKQLGLQAYAVHATYQFAGTEGKRHRFREARLFFDSPEYYAPSGGLLSFNASIPKDLLEGGSHTIESHFALVNYQMKQIRDALAIASILNRTLVMPPLWCRFDRLWFGHPGVLPFTKTQQPFLCPMDHVFEVSNMLKKYDVEEFGPIIDFREYSFLDNPRVPVKVKDSRLKVELCEGADCSSGTSEGRISLPTNLTDEQIAAHLVKHKDAPVIEFTSMRNAFGGFAEKSKRSKFRRRVQMYTGIWCCVMKLQRGHIFYDIFWDEKFNWKPVPPTTPEDDHPPFD